MIGGVPLTGGRGSPLAVVMGALILTITASLLYFADVSSFYQSLIDGVILLAGGRQFRRARLRPGAGAPMSGADDPGRRRHRLRAPRVGDARRRAGTAVRLLARTLIVLAERLAPGFASAGNILQLLKLASFLGLVALGQTMVMLVGGIDLSIAWVLTASAVVFTSICAGQDANMLPRGGCGHRRSVSSPASSTASASSSCGSRRSS